MWGAEGGRARREQGQDLGPELRLTRKDQSSTPGWVSARNKSSKGDHGLRRAPQGVFPQKKTQYVQTHGAQDWGVGEIKTLIQKNELKHGQKRWSSHNVERAESNKEPVREHLGRKKKTKKRNAKDEKKNELAL